MNKTIQNALVFTYLSEFSLTMENLKISQLHLHLSETKKNPKKQKKLISPGI